MNKGTIYVLVGIEGSGKSIFASQMAKEGFTVISARDTMKSLNEDRERPTVYNEMRNKINITDKKIVFNAKNLSFKQRKKLYNKFKDTHQIHNILFYTNLDEALWKRTTEDGIDIIRQVKTFSPFKVGEDCDTYDIQFVDTWFSYITGEEMIKTLTDVVYGNEKIYHLSKYHIETVNEHIKESVLVANEMYPDSKYIGFYALIHDWGKLYSTSIGKFHGHENISAYLSIGLIDILHQHTDADNHDMSIMEFAWDVINHMDNKGHWFNDIDREASIKLPDSIVNVEKFQLTDDIKLNKQFVMPEIDIIDKLRNDNVDYIDSHYDELTKFFKLSSITYGTGKNGDKIIQIAPGYNLQSIRSGEHLTERYICISQYQNELVIGSERSFTSDFVNDAKKHLPEMLWQVDEKLLQTEKYTFVFKIDGITEEYVLTEVICHTIYIHYRF